MQEKRLQNRQKANKLYPSTRYKPPTPLLSLQSMDPPSKLHIQKLNRSSESIRIHSISRSPILKTIEKRFDTIQRKDQQNQKGHDRQRSERRLDVSQNKKKKQTLRDKQIEGQNTLRQKLVRMKIEIQKIHGEHIDLEDIQINVGSQKQQYYRERMKNSGCRIIAKVLKSKIKKYFAIIIARPISQLKILRL